MTESTALFRNNGVPTAFIRFGQVLMIAALLAASGGHWVALQSVAWGTMLVDYGRTSRFCEAVSKTFDGNHPCALCKSIEKSRAAEKKTGAQVVPDKLDLFWQQDARIAPPLLSFRDHLPFRCAVECRAHLPLLQPPRALLG